MLHRLVYRSRSTIPPSEAEAETARILARASGANAKRGITGALLLADGQFLQAIEGPLAEVEALFERICSDLRHRDVQLLEFAPAEDRLFAGWAMERIDHEDELLSRLPLADGEGAPAEPMLAPLAAQLAAGRTSA